MGRSFKKFGRESGCGGGGGTFLEGVGSQR